MKDRMKAALWAWCKAYQKAVDENQFKRPVKHYFLDAYQLTVNDRFFDLPHTEQPLQKTTDGQTLGEACGTELPIAVKDVCVGQKCATCRWREDGTGLMPCRRHGPRRVDMENLTDDMLWPYVWPTDWCGEWEGKPMVEPPIITASTLKTFNDVVGNLEDPQDRAMLQPVVDKFKEWNRSSKNRKEV